MHNNHSMKRQRGRGRKPGGGGGGGGHHSNQGHQHPNRTLDSNGPEGKVRGPAAFVHERYLQLARDASASGDRVLAENFFQHADHYFRLLRAMQPAMPVPQERSLNDGDFDGDDEGGGETEAADDGGARGGEDQPEAANPGRPQQEASDRAERGDGEFRRRRGRRNRFRPGGGENEEGDAREPRESSGGRESAREEESPAGFSTGPRPAFLRQE